MISEEAFSRHVKDALANFYDPVHLQTHPLGDLLAMPQSSGETRSQALRQALREAIEALKPAANIPLSRPEWLGYRLLWLRYVQSLGPAEIAEELALSRASFFRHQQEALEAVVSLLWERYEQSSAEPRPKAALAERVRQEAVKVSQASTYQPVAARGVLQGVLRTIQPLAEQQGIDLQIDLADALPMLYGDPILLRQILLNVLLEGLKHTRGRALHLTGEVTDEQLTWRLEGLRLPALDSQDWQRWPGMAASQGLLQVLGGRMELLEAQGLFSLALALRLAPLKTILLIDDDADTLALVQRYLQVRYRLLVAQRGDQAMSLLANTWPDLILLDVLMPEEDGWDVLQRLKASPRTASIPVVICSVLAQPALALTLGAAGVLQKPLDQEALLEMIDRLV